VSNGCCRPAIRLNAKGIGSLRLQKVGNLLQAAADFNVFHEGCLAIRREVIAEPVPRQHRYSVQGAGLFEQVSGSRDDF
jgi:hypothetical protein